MYQRGKEESYMATLQETKIGESIDSINKKWYTPQTKLPFISTYLNENMCR